MKKQIPLKAIYVVFAIAFLIRIAVPFAAYHSCHNFSKFYTSDSSSYIAPAQSIAKTLEFNNSKGEPEIVRTPGYPLLIIPGILLGHTEAVTIFFQVIISFLTILIIYKTALELFEDFNAAFFSALLAGVSRVLIINTYKLMTETLSTAILTLFLYYIIVYFKKKELKYIIMSAIFLAMSIYVRPAAYYLPLFLIPCMLVWLLLKKELTKTIIIHLTIFIVLTSGLIMIWQIRNKTVANYTHFSAIVDINQYFYNAASVLAVKEGVSFLDMRNKLGFYKDIRLAVKDTDNIEFLSSGEAYNFVRKKASAIILDNPLLYTKIHIVGMFRTLISGGIPSFSKVLNRYFWFGGITGLIIDQGITKTLHILSEEKKSVLIIYFLSHIGVLIYYIFVIITLLKKGIKNKEGVIILIITAIYFLIISGGVLGHDRFRHPMVPSICILGGMGMAIVFKNIMEKWKSKTLKQHNIL
ncbi:MAG: glycosyltransferase family 39 protein [Nitrospirae bacterium]|nr:glycosyltransferase family 39 protein [Nitrospirota bacterium]